MRTSKAFAATTAFQCPGAPPIRAVYQSVKSSRLQKDVEDRKVSIVKQSNQLSYDLVGTDDNNKIAQITAFTHKEELAHFASRL